MSWGKRSAESIIPLSVNQSNLKDALKEWLYTGDMFDLEEPIEVCQLCKHPDIRYQFKIKNQLNANEMFVGSECITKFNIGALDEFGNLLNQDDSRKKVNRDRRHLVTEARKRRLINTLIKLSRVDQNFNIDSFIDYVQDRGAFTPNQLFLLFWRFKKFNIEYVKSDFKLIIRRGREKEQLLEMEDWKVKQLWGAMSKDQKKWFSDSKDYRF